MAEVEFARLWASWEGFDMDLTATTASSPRMPVGVRGAGDKLHFYSRYDTDGNSGVDVFSQDVSVMPDKSSKCFGFSFPPTTTVGVVLQHMGERQAHAVVSRGTRSEAVVVDEASRGNGKVPVGVRVRRGWQVLPASPPEENSILPFSQVEHEGGRSRV